MVDLFVESVVEKSIGKRREYLFFSVFGWTSPCVPTLIQLGEGTVQATSADSAYQKGDIFYRNCSGKAMPEFSVFIWLFCYTPTKRCFSLGV